MFMVGHTLIIIPYFIIILYNTPSYSFKTTNSCLFIDIKYGIFVLNLRILRLRVTAQ